MALATGLGVAKSRARARLYVELNLAAGTHIDLAAAQAHYLTRVMRLDQGAAVTVFNGREGEWAAEISATGKNRCSLLVHGLRRPQAPVPDLTLLFAPIKRQAFDLLVRQATELGVSRFRPVITARTVAERVNMDRLRAITIEAAEQCERLDLPDLVAAERLDRVLAAWPVTRRLFLCDETGQGEPIQQVFRAGATGPVAVLCGPEGGFTPAELDAVRDLPFVTPVTLGPRILRAETAALAVVAVWQALSGDWAQPPPRRIGGLHRTSCGTVPSHLQE